MEALQRAIDHLSDASSALRQAVSEMALSGSSAELPAQAIGLVREIDEKTAQARQLLQRIAPPVQPARRPAAPSPALKTEASTTPEAATQPAPEPQPAETVPAEQLAEPNQQK